MKRKVNHGLKKVCSCPRRNWATTCLHSWYFEFKPRGGERLRFALDRELGRHIADRDEAMAETERIRAAIRDGTFQRRDSIVPVPVVTPTPAPMVFV